MKTSITWTVAVCMLAGFSLQASAQDWTADYDRLLKKYVVPGGVKYAAWKANAADMAALQQVVDAIASSPSSSAKTPEQLAFHINAYNAWILHNILEKYPAKGPLAISLTFFHGKNIQVAGKKMSFDTLEQKMIRPRFQEPRVHFALNCASASCPPLMPGVFQAGKIDQQLEKLTVAFINTPKAAKVSSKELELSKIFDWYKDDFAPAGGAVAFINKYRKSPLPKDVPVKFQNYDWSLNEVK